MKAELDTIQAEMAYVQEFFSRVVKIIPRFNIVDPKILPYGLKPHTRSVSWIVEQVVVQQAKYNSRALGVRDVKIDLPDTCLHDCEVIREDGQKFFVNIKITSAARRQKKNDIAAVERLYMQYSADPNYRIIYVVLAFAFEDTEISFVKDGVHVFSPQFLPIYVNPRNDKLQASYYATPELRSRDQFLRELKTNSKSIML